MSQSLPLFKGLFKKPFYASLCLVSFIAVSLDGYAQQSATERFSSVIEANERALAARANFDINTGNGAIDFVVNSIPQEAFNEVSPAGGDASLILRFTTLLINAWFDASAPYHESAVGVYSDLGRRPASESENNRNINIALIHASYHVLNSLLPLEKPVWRQMMVDAGLDPDSMSEDLTTPEGIGNVAGKAVVSARENDGMNQLGNEKDLYSFFADTYQTRTPYRDYTHYIPKNTVDYLSDPSRWQPDLVRNGVGIYRSQRFVTPQYARVIPYSYHSPKIFRFPKPYRSEIRNFDEYQQQALEVLDASASLTDQQKLKAEFFDGKINSLIGSVLVSSAQQQLSLLENIHFQFMTSVATFDAGIVVWQEKRRFDAVRPFSAIRYLYGDRPITAWGGVGQGTVNDLPANEWRSYLQSADHPEYPSASTCFCYAHAQSAKNYTGNDGSLNFTVPFSQGQSRIEPGITPSSEETLQWDTWTEFAQDCGQSRVWAGVHFQSAVDVSANSCRVFGDIAYDYVSSLIEGKRPSKKALTKKYNKQIKNIRHW
ncbi:MAG: vanadium-dependent haloperoxidase [Cellvibrionaceae bacterium]|nr:vanadium-dependent haloperoxidase [Cellvibrionaceae bacterium]